MMETLYDISSGDLHELWDEADMDSVSKNTIQVNRNLAISCQLLITFETNYALEKSALPSLINF